MPIATSATSTKLRREAYAQMPAPSWSTLWAGNDNALLTIFRHFDSASVSKGLIGDVPLTTGCSTTRCSSAPTINWR